MHFTKEKIAWLSVLLITSGYLSAPPTGIAQERGHESPSIQAAPNRTQPNILGRTEAQRNNSGVPADSYSYYNGAPYGYYDPYSAFYGFYYYRSYYNGQIYDQGYSDGFNAGRYDRGRGIPYNPRQYERSGAGVYFAGFVAGYEDGYNC